MILTNNQMTIINRPQVEDLYLHLITMEIKDIFLMLQNFPAIFSVITLKDNQLILKNQVQTKTLKL